jgi:hypothetical protein
VPPRGKVSDAAAIFTRNAHGPAFPKESLRHSQRPGSDDYLDRDL